MLPIRNLLATMLFTFFLFLAALPVSAAQSQTAPPDLVLHGTVDAQQNKTYVDVPFRVPSGVHRLTIMFSYSGRDQHTVLDLSLFDPNGFRGSSGGNKSEFTLSGTDATPSYLPGPIIPGGWTLELGVPNIRPGMTSHYTAQIFFNRAIDDDSFTPEPLRTGAAWYRGDLHMHTAHSDGSCASETGRKVPCPVFLTVEAAVKRGLDFIAITDHNSTSQYDAMRELQPFFDKTLLIPGREITTFHGHMNIWGTTQFVDYRVGTAAVPSINTVLRAAHRLGVLASINHPEAPTGEICMGCGWNPDPPADMSLVNGIEVANGGGNMLLGLSFWRKQLADGYRITAVGGSDNHNALENPERPGSVGDPTTVVYAPELSVAGILGGIRAGHVFVDLTGSPDRMLAFSATDGAQLASMGDALAARAGDTLTLQLDIEHCVGDMAQLLLDGKPENVLPDTSISSNNQQVTLRWTSDGKRHWIEPEVRDKHGDLVLIGNPVYINFGATTTAEHAQ